MNNKGYFTDDFGVTWNQSGVDKDIGVIDSPVIDAPDITLYPTPVLNENRIREDCERLLATKEDRFTSETVDQIFAWILHEIAEAGYCIVW